MTLNEVLKNTNYDVSLFSEEARKYVEDAIVVKTIRGKESVIVLSMKEYHIIEDRMLVHFSLRIATPFASMKKHLNCQL